MRIIVDKVPEKPEECYFAEYSGAGFYDCVLDHSGCSLCYASNSCDKLVVIGECFQYDRTTHLFLKEDYEEGCIDI